VQGVAPSQPRMRQRGSDISAGTKAFVSRERAGWVRRYCFVVGLPARVTLTCLVRPPLRAVRVILSPTVRSRTWAMSDKAPSMGSPSTAMIASPSFSPALLAGVPLPTAAMTAAGRLAGLALQKLVSPSVGAAATTLAMVVSTALGGIPRIGYLLWSSTCC